MPVSMEGLRRHYRLSAKESNFTVNLKNAASKLLLGEGLEIALIRLSCIPVKLPELIIVEFSKLLLQNQCDLLTKLKVLCLSPLSKLHLLDLVLNCSENSGFVVDYADELLNDLFVNPNAAGQFKLYKTILNWVSDEACYLSEIKHWAAATKIGIIWAHANALYSMFVAGGVDPDDLAELLKGRNSISTEIVMRDRDFWHDVLHPKRFNRARLVIDGIANILEDKERKVVNALKLEEKITAYISNKENILDIFIFADPLLLKDNLSSMFGGDRGRHLSLFDPKIYEEFSSDNLRRRVENSIKSINSDPKDRDSWLELSSIMGDLPIYKELSAEYVKLFKNLDIESFMEDDPYTAVLALRTGARQVVHLGEGQIRAKLEDILLYIAIFFAKKKEDMVQDDVASLLMDNNSVALSLIESALSISLNPDSPSDTTRNFSRLTEKIFNIWPLTADVFSGVFGLVQELPAEQLHGMWQLVLANRALRKG